MENRPSMRKLSFSERARSLPFPQHFHSSLRWLAITLLFFICFITSGACLYFAPSPENAYILIAFLVVTIITWIIGFLVRKRATCPLCKGTPFLDSRARVHQKAIRFFPLNYGTTNLIRACLTRRFRCHFCGSPFDLLKVYISGTGFEKEKS